MSDFITLDVLLIGGGAIGQVVLRETLGDLRLRITHVLDVPQVRERLQQTVGPDIQVISSLDELAALPDVVIECAGHPAVKSHVPALLREGVDVLLISVGSLAEPGLAQMLEEAALEGGAQLTLASGEKVCDLRNLTQATVIFEGSAGEAARLYPKNANVAATVSLAGLGLERTRATLIADPAVTQNIHNVRARGAFGELEVTISGKPLADNPKTSALAAYNAVRLLRNRVAALVI